MRIFCHYPGGYQLGPVKLEFGENLVDDQIWADAMSRLSDGLKVALMGGNTPTIIPAKDGGEQASLPLAPEPEPMLARDAIALVEAATEPDQLEGLAHGETRKTVLAAIQKRARQLAEAAA